ncbi:MAG TPA: hypothetical protein DCE42_11115 [Myxococcales bacterium]|nr:hypothetical protein [Myxococcales bacterium]
MKTNTSETTANPSKDIDNTRANELFERAKKELVAIDPKSIKQPRVTHQRAAELSSQMLSSLAPRWAHVKDILQPKVFKEYQTQYDEISNHALVFFAAGAAFENSLTTEEAKELKQLVPIVAEHDAYMISWFRPVFRDNADVLNIIDNEISPGRSRLDSAEDVLRLCQLGATHRQLITTLTPLTKTYFDKAEADATRLFQLLAKEGQSKHDAQDLWYRAYTKWADTYYALRNLGTFIFGGGPETQTMFPRIFTPKTKKVSPDTEPAETTFNSFIS